MHRGIRGAPRDGKGAAWISHGGPLIVAEVRRHALSLRNLDLGPAYAMAPAGQTGRVQVEEARVLSGCTFNLF